MNELQIKDQDIAIAIGTHVAHFNATVDRIKLIPGEHYKVINQGKKIRIYLVPGLKIIYQALAQGKNQAAAAKLKQLIEQKKEEHLSAQVTQVVIENCQSLKTINKSNYITIQETIRIFRTESKTFQQVLGKIKQSEKPLKADEHFTYIEGVTYISLSGIYRIGEFLADHLSNSARKKWCNTVVINVKHLYPQLTGLTKKQIIDKAKEQALERDKHKCQITGFSGLKGQIEVDVHHLYNAKHYPQLEDSLDNLLTISTALHCEFHAWMGGTNQPCTIDDLIRFIVQLYPEYRTSLITLNRFRTRLYAPYPPTPLGKQPAA
ncbi:hypothetical protein [Synechococcus sp. PCC 6312]|uniref:hypothetical protein n=1 Tax=Synechococcus sp. (strain ATCC 27167 / PCC 6312) TaxID=195253 RepID=UPI00029F4465|nr:hypothetical protein [Synechococcus sp. PCC 6312]AFY60320.1 hypothetical protein Syn6312_1131 [Synechococcus sp. PCC 6312]